MYFDKNEAYPVGTFKLGQKIYKITTKTHIFNIHKPCDVCDNTGHVMIKGREYPCPNCLNNCTYHYVDEMVMVDRTYTVKGVYTFKNKNNSYEIYIDGNPHDCILIKKSDGKNYFFASEEEALEECRKYNEENNVKMMLEKYRRISLETD